MATFNLQHQILIDNFVKELSRKVGEKFDGDIDFIILYGSAARGEFVKGSSDIDLLIQVTRDEAIKSVRGFATEIFWELDKKYGTEFDKVCSREAHNIFEKIFKKVESKTPLFAPLFVFGPNDLDWKNGRVKKREIVFGANLFASQSSVFLNFKREGKVYWGRNIIPEINANFTEWEKIKGILIPQYFEIAALVMWLFLWKKSVKYATKGVLYEIDAALIYLDKVAKYSFDEKTKLSEQLSYRREIVDFLKEYLVLDVHVKSHKFHKNNFAIVRDSLEYKINGFNGGRFSALAYILRCFKFVFLVNLSVIFKKLFFPFY